eukprot:UN21576
MPLTSEQFRGELVSLNDLRTVVSQYKNMEKELNNLRILQNAVSLKKNIRLDRPGTTAGVSRIQDVEIEINTTRVQNDNLTKLNRNLLHQVEVHEGTIEELRVRIGVINMEKQALEKRLQSINR